MVRDALHSSGHGDRSGRPSRGGVRTRVLAAFLLTLPPAATVGCRTAALLHESAATLLAVRPDDEGETGYLIVSTPASGVRLLVRRKGPTSLRSVGIVVDSGTVQPESPEVSRRGPLVKDIVAGSPAAEWGIRPGDRILELSGTTIESEDDLVAALLGRRIGEADVLRLLREGIVLEVPLPARRSSAPDPLIPPERVDLPSRWEVTCAGLEVATLPAEWVSEILGASGSRAVISSIVTGGPAYRAGLRPGTSW